MMIRKKAKMTKMKILTTMPMMKTSWMRMVISKKITLSLRRTTLMTRQKVLQRNQIRISRRMTIRLKQERLTDKKMPLLSTIEVRSLMKFTIIHKTQNQQKSSSTLMKMMSLACWRSIQNPKLSVSQK